MPVMQRKACPACFDALCEPGEKFCRSCGFGHTANTGDGPLRDAQLAALALAGLDEPGMPLG
jgi:hypothetical protein